jgi:ubiquinone/menaquinone biosynthesis C-methylase UbiE
MNVGISNESTRVNWLQVTLETIPSGSRILDAGAGEQRFRRFCGHLNYVAQDFGQYDGTGNRAALQTGSWDQSTLDIVSDITAIPQPDASFDAIMCTEVLEHLPDPLAAFREFARLLKPGGYLILTAPFCSLTHFAPFHFSTGFSRYFYERHLTDLGFEIIELVPNGNYFEYLAQEIRRIPSVATRYAQDQTSRLEQYCIRWMLRILERFSGKDSGSSELLCFGYHALAKKVVEW